MSPLYQTEDTLEATLTSHLPHMQLEQNASIIAPITSENTEGARKLAPLSELRYSEALGPAGIIIVDEGELMLCERLPDDNNPDVGADVGFWTNSK